MTGISAVAHSASSPGQICIRAGRAWKPGNNQLVQVSPSNTTHHPPGFECKLRDGFHGFWVTRRAKPEELDKWLITGFCTPR